MFYDPTVYRGVSVEGLGVLRRSLHVDAHVDFLLRLPHPPLQQQHCPLLPHPSHPVPQPEHGWEHFRNFRQGDEFSQPALARKDYWNVLGGREKY